MRPIKIVPAETPKLEGELVVVDPCYIWDHNQSNLSAEWDEIVRQMFPSDSPPLHDKGIIEVQGVRVLYTSTKHGDGEYWGYASNGTSNHQGIGVDAGCICVILLEDLLLINPASECFKNTLVISNFKGSITATGEGFTGDLTVDTE